MEEQRRAPILVVEDSPEDYEVAVRAFQMAGLAHPIIRCSDGDMALDYLHWRGAYAPPVRAAPPSLILLDLNLPGTDGREVLKEIKHADHLKMIPVIVLTNSADQRDIASCYQAGANSYIRKPVDLDGFFKAMRCLKDYWFKVVALPQ